MNNENQKELSKDKEWNPKEIMLRSHQLQLTIKSLQFSKNHKSSVNGET